MLAPSEDDEEEEKEESRHEKEKDRQDLTVRRGIVGGGRSQRAVDRRRRRVNFPCRHDTRYITTCTLRLYQEIGRDALYNFMYATFVPGNI